MTQNALSLRGYARHRRKRGLAGGHLQAVQRAIASERLNASIVRVNGQLRIADVDLADREWAANTDLSRAPATVIERSGSGAAPLPPGVVGDVGDFRVYALPDLELVEVHYDEQRDEDWEPGEAPQSYAAGIEPPVSRRLGELLIEAARRASRR